MKYTGFLFAALLLTLCSCKTKGTYEERNITASALKQKNPAVMEKMLLSKGVNRSNPDGSTPLTFAVSRNRPDAVAILLKHGAKANRKNQRGTAPLHIAAAMKDTRCLDLLLAQKVDLEVRSSFGRTPLMDAARTGSLESMKKLLAKGAKINARDKFNRTALMHAACAPAKDALPCVKFLLEKGADEKAFDKENRIAAMHAAEVGNTEAALFLMKRIPELNRKPVLCLMFLISAVKGGDLKVAEYLVGQDAPLTRKPSLILRVTKPVRMDGMYELLVRNDLLPHDRTALMYAAEKNDLAMVQFLVEHGADVNATDEKGFQAEDLATRRTVISYLRSQGKKQLEREMNKK